MPIVPNIALTALGIDIIYNVNTNIIYKMVFIHSQKVLRILR